MMRLRGWARDRQTCGDPGLAHRAERSRGLRGNGSRLSKGFQPDLRAGIRSRSLRAPRPLTGLLKPVPRQATACRNPRLSVFDHSSRDRSAPAEVLTREARRMKTIKGPAIFLAQFAGDDGAVQLAGRRSAAGPRRSATRACRSRPGTAGCSTSRRRPTAKTYCDEVKGIAREHGVEITELSTHLQGQLVAVHPAYDDGFDAFARAAGARQSEGAPGMGGRAGACAAPRPRSNLGLDGARRPSPARSPGPTSIPGRSARPG